METFPGAAAAAAGATVAAAAKDDEEEEEEDQNGQQLDAEEEGDGGGAVPLLASRAIEEADVAVVAGGPTDELRLRRRAQLAREREARHEARRRACIYNGCNALLLGAGVLLLVTGVLRAENADDSRMHDWKFTLCNLTDAWISDLALDATGETQGCIFFTALPRVAPATNGAHAAACAVLADFSDHAYTSAPACGAVGAPAPAYAAEWLREITQQQQRNGSSNEANKVVDCMVPLRHNFVPADRCAFESTASGYASALQRNREQRYVYLLRDRDDGVAVVHHVTEPERRGGREQATAGAVVLLLGIAALGLRGFQLGRRHGEERARAAYVAYMDSRKKW